MLEDLEIEEVIKSDVIITGDVTNATINQSPEH
jgi:hypothetical protein